MYTHTRWKMKVKEEKLEMKPGFIATEVEDEETLVQKCKRLAQRVRGKVRIERGTRE